MSYVMSEGYPKMTPLSQLPNQPLYKSNEPTTNI